MVTMVASPYKACSRCQKICESGITKCKCGETHFRDLTDYERNNSAIVSFYVLERTGEIGEARGSRIFN